MSGHLATRPINLAMAVVAVFWCCACTADGLSMLPISLGTIEPTDFRPGFGLIWAPKSQCCLYCVFMGEAKTSCEFGIPMNEIRWHCCRIDVLVMRVMYSSPNSRVARGDP
jgi:hypothetical protein